MALENDLYDSFLFEMEDKSDELIPETTEWVNVWDIG
jgi:hypothetical protein